MRYRALFCANAVSNLRGDWKTLRQSTQFTIAVRWPHCDGVWSLVHRHRNHRLID